MIRRAVTDWDDAYANAPHIDGGEAYPAHWASEAASFRNRMEPGRAEIDLAYGSDGRQRYDLFLPKGGAKGLVLFIHGGYWLKFDKSAWSHLATGPLAIGWAVAMPSYRLCPQVRVADITRDVAAALTNAASRIAGPIRLAGHSAGGHLVTRMACVSGPLEPVTAGRIAHVVSISGLHDLRPLMRTAMNKSLRIDDKEAHEESPALLAPRPGIRLTCWVGAAERAEFLRQNALLANVWTGLGAATACVEEPDRHHFNVIDGLTDPDHPLTRMLVEA